MGMRLNPKTGRVEDSVFVKGHEITAEEIRRSRGKRREALKEARKMQREGFMRLKDLDRLDYTIRNAALQVWPKDCITVAQTEYEPRGYYGKPELRKESWIKCPIEGVEPWQVMKVAEINFQSRPQYRATWEVHLALQLEPEEIEVELMMAAMGGDNA